MKYQLLIVESTTDFVVVQKDYCQTCFENKSNERVLSSIVELDGSTVKELKKYDVSAYNVICKCDKSSK
jgi:hypothetical protein